MARRKQQSRRSFKRTVLSVLFAVIMLPLMLLGLLLYLPSLLGTYIFVWTLWLTRGKDILFVYSDSPIWQEYMTTEILPRVRSRAIVLNWSERNKWSWWWLRVQAFRLFGGNREFNPMVVWFRPFRRAQTFRFLRPFEDWKHGYKEPVERLTQGMLSALSVEDNRTRQI